MQTASIVPLRRTSGCPFDLPHLLLFTAEIRTLVGPLIKHDITLEEITCSILTEKGTLSCKSYDSSLTPYCRKQQ